MISLLLIVLLLSHWTVVNAAQPLFRWNHATMLNNNKLYLFGGQIGSTPYNGSDPLTPRRTNDSAELWILDMTQSFSTTSLPWTSGPSGGHPSSYITENYGGPKYELLITYGESPNSLPLSTNGGDFHYYNINSGQWSTAQISTSSHPTPRQGHTVVNRLNDWSIIMYAGIPPQDPSPSPNVTSSPLPDIWVLDTIKLIWTQLFPINPPPSRFHHSSTLLSDGKMYVIGGYSGNAMVDMNRINIFDTNAKSWSVQYATGVKINPRRQHRAVGTSDNKIIIFGGTDETYTSYFNDVPVLDTKSFTWTNQTPSGTAPAGRYAHAMTMVGTNIIITYGATPSWNNDTGFFVLNTASTPYTWKTVYTPQNLDLTLVKPPPNRPKFPSWAIPVVVILGVAILVAIIIGLFLWFRKPKRDHGFPPSDLGSTSRPDSRYNDAYNYQPERVPQDNLATKVPLPR